jgi:hypothetical protein
MKHCEVHIMNKQYILIIAVVAVLFLLAGCSKSPSGAVVAGQEMTVFKSPTCGCCGVWTEYMDKQGFDVEIVQMDNLQNIKEQYNIPPSMRSCHTAVVGDYFIEGHIPQEAIDKLLEEKPDIAGIAMPGMPSGSPGMPGQKRGDFVIYAVDHNGGTSEFVRI